MRNNARWTEVGTLVYHQPKIIYQVPIELGVGWTENLGAVKLRHDGRWDWWRWESCFHKWATGQGVAATESEAKAMVLKGWET